MRACLLIMIFSEFEPSLITFFGVLFVFIFFARCVQPAAAAPPPPPPTTTVTISQLKFS